MTNERPLILITNDDGVWAKGINELIECLKDLGDLVVFAPDGPRSGMGSAITSLVPIKYTLLKKEEGLTIYSCTGTPVDCVKLAINEVLERKHIIVRVDGFGAFESSCQPEYGLSAGVLGTLEFTYPTAIRLATNFQPFHLR